MRVEYTFDEAKIKENGYSRERIYSALNEEYSEKESLYAAEPMMY